ncbi:MAG: B12-binding domain-containing radical SAM protein [Myxococcaceae bacterium]
MRVTFVHPAGYNFVPGMPDVTLLANRMAPTGILQLAAWLDGKGHTTFVHDCLGPYAPKGLEKNAELVLATDPDMVGFSTTTSAFLDAYEMAVYIKKKRPHVKTVFGAVHVSAIGAPLMHHYPAIDYLCVGEGEGLVGDLADGVAPKDIGNLVYRDGEQVIANPRRARMVKLDDIPFPAYSKLAGFPRDYYLPLFSYVKRYGATMITSRGCPYTCSYCDRTVFERLYKYNSPEYVWEHMRRLRDEFGVHHINFYDDLFTASRKRVIELCEALIEKPLGMDFNCAIRVGHTDDELLAILKKAGCLMVSMGIESADAAMMERHKTGVTLDAVRDTVERVHAKGMRAKGLFIFGLPGETPATVKCTSDFINSMDFDEMNMTKFTPFHGAPMWNQCVSREEGSFHEDWRMMNCLNFVYVPKAFSSKEQMDYLYNQHLQTYYQSKKYRRRFGKRVWEHRWSLWHMFKNLFGFLGAKKYFTPDQKQLTATNEWPPLHPAQPKSLDFALPETVAEAFHEDRITGPQLLKSGAVVPPGA